MANFFLACWVTGVRTSIAWLFKRVHDFASVFGIKDGEVGESCFFTTELGEKFHSAWVFECLLIPVFHDSEVDNLKVGFDEFAFGRGVEELVEFVAPAAP